MQELAVLACEFLRTDLVKRKGGKNEFEYMTNTNIDNKTVSNGGEHCIHTRDWVYTGLASMVTQRAYEILLERNEVAMEVWYAYVVFLLLGFCL